MGASAKKSSNNNNSATRAKKEKRKETDNSNSSTTTTTPRAHESDTVVTVNRAPVLCLWTAVVAQREGYTWEEGLSFGKYVTAMFAQAKGRSLGIFKEKEEKEIKRQKRKEEVYTIEAAGVSIHVADTSHGVRAMTSKGPIDSASAQAYINKSFGDKLEEIKGAMQALAQAYAKEHIGKEAYHLYEQFRPTVAPGKRGWGQKGSPSVRTIRSLIPQQRQTTLFGRQAEKKKEEEEETAGAQKEEKEAEEERPKKRGKVSAIH